MEGQGFNIDRIYNKKRFKLLFCDIIIVVVFFII